MNLNLHMSSEGFIEMAEELKILDDESPQVYIHIGSDDPFNGDVLRIGKAESGSYDRWIKSTVGHQSTFLWATGESKKYEKYVLRKCPSDYLLFFASLYGYSTRLVVLKFTSIEIAKRCENDLIDFFCPVWERYKRLRKGSVYPPLTGIKAEINDYASISRTVARLGGALEDIKAQRAGSQPYEQVLPDILNMKVNSLKKWSVQSCQDIYTKA